MFIVGKSFFSEIEQNTLKSVPINKIVYTWIFTMVLSYSVMENFHMRLPQFEHSVNILQMYKRDKFQWKIIIHN